MSKTLYVGNMNYGTDERSLSLLFSQFGEVDGTRIVHDRDGRHRGYGFVKMEDDEQAHTAQLLLDGKNFEGRKLHVSEAFEMRSGQKKAE